MCFKIGKLSTIKAFDPDAALKTDKVVVLELLQKTLTKQTPGVTEELISVVITVSDIMLQAVFVALANALQLRQISFLDDAASHVNRMHGTDARRNFKSKMCRPRTQQERCHIQ